MMKPGCMSFSLTSLSWPMTCAFLVRACTSNFSMRDLEPGLTEQAEKTAGFTEREEEIQRRVCVCARVCVCVWRWTPGCLTSLGLGSWGLSSWHRGVEGWKSAGSRAGSLLHSSTVSQKSRRSGTSSAHVCPHTPTYRRPSAPRWRPSFWNEMTRHKTGL